MAKRSKFLDSLAVQVAGGQSIKDGSSIVGCSIQHAYNLSVTAEFRKRVADIRSEVTAQSVGLLTTAANRAAGTLLELLDSSQQPAIRLNAAKAILASLAPVSELGELRHRLDAIEKQAATG